jgi:hypothetical protein
MLNIVVGRNCLHSLERESCTIAETRSNVILRIKKRTLQIYGTVELVLRACMYVRVWFAAFFPFLLFPFFGSVFGKSIFFTTSLFLGLEREDDDVTSTLLSH